MLLLVCDCVKIVINNFNHYFGIFDFEYENLQSVFNSFIYKFYENLIMLKI